MNPPKIRPATLAFLSGQSDMKNACYGSPSCRRPCPSAGRGGDRKSGVPAIGTPLFLCADAQRARSIILFLGLEVGLRMLAGGAYLGCLRGLADITAVAALPPYLAVAPEEIAVGKAAQQLEVTLLVLRLDRRDGPERRRHFGETLLLGDAAEVAIEHVPLLALAVRSGQQILGRRTDRARRVGGRNFDLAALQKLEETFGVLFLLLGGLQENPGHLFVALFFGPAGKENVAAPGLALARKGLEQILFGARAPDALFHDDRYLVSRPTANSAANRLQEPFETQKDSFTISY